MDFRIKYAGGCKRARDTARLTRILAWCITGLLPTAMHAAENEALDGSESTLPDLEFLEFLGQFETDNGEWIDPGSLLAEEFEDLLGVAETIVPAAEDDNRATDQ